MNEMTTALATTTDHASELRSWEALKEQSKIALASRYLPKSIQTTEQAITIAMAGRELGLPPMTSFRLIHLIEGKPTMAAELLLALAYKKIPGFRLDVLKTTNEGCAVSYWRPGMDQPSPPFVFTVQDANRAGLTGKNNWKNFPAAMCRARAIASALRVGAADATLGMSSTEEIVDGDIESSTPYVDAPAPAAPPASPVDALKQQLRQQQPPPAVQLAAPAQVPAQAARKPARSRRVEQVVETPFGPAVQHVEVQDAAQDAPPELEDRGDDPKLY